MFARKQDRDVQEVRGEGGRAGWVSVVGVAWKV